MREEQLLAESFINGNISHVREKLSRKPTKTVIRTVQWVKEYYPEELDCFLRLMGK